MKREHRPWKETAISLDNVKALMLDGPGDDVTIVVRGTRAKTASERKDKRRLRAR